MQNVFGNRHNKYTETVGYTNPCSVNFESYTLKLLRCGKEICTSRKLVSELIR